MMRKVLIGLVLFVAITGLITPVLAVPAQTCAVVSRGEGYLWGTWAADFDISNGLNNIFWTPPIPNGRWTATNDVLWICEMAPLSPSTMVNLGKVDPQKITITDLLGYSYSSNPIPLSEITRGDVFVIHTAGGNYAVVEVTGGTPCPSDSWCGSWCSNPNTSQYYNVELKWVTYNPNKCGSPIPEFPSPILPAAMVIGFLGAVLFIRRTREN